MKDLHDQAVVVAGLSLNGATVMRRLARMGYHVWGVSYDPAEQGWHVSGVQRRPSPHPTEEFEAWLAFMRQLAEQFDEPPPLLPMSDNYVLALDRGAQQLDGAFRTHGFGTGIRGALTSKQQTFELAAQHQFPAAKTRLVTGREELAEFAAGVPGQVLIKPDLAPQWRSGAAAAVAGGRKVIVCHDVDSLLAAYDEIAPHTPQVLAQEVIPGPDHNLIYWCGFVGPEGHVGGRLIGRKRRLTPIHYGSATFVELVDLPQVEELCERFLVAVGYQGLCGVELKEDPRDGIAKLIEVNARYSLWDDIGIPVGIDLAREAVESLLGGPTVPTRPRRFGQKWVELGRDLPAFLRYRREGDLSLWGWLRSLTPPIRVNDMPLVSDPRYAFHMLTRRFRKLMA